MLLLYYAELNPILDADEKKKIESEYTQWISQQPSCVDGDHNVGKTHHVRTANNSGTGIKPNDLWRVPCTHKQHVQAHASKTARVMKEIFLMKIPELHKQFLETHTEIGTKVRTFQAIQNHKERKSK